MSPQTFRLPVSAGVRECAALKQQLLALVASADAVSIDISGVELVDTAALQLLFAFSRERNANGLMTIWHGNSPTFLNAAAAMGLQMGDRDRASTNSACLHDA